MMSCRVARKTVVRLLAVAALAAFAGGAAVVGLTPVTGLAGRQAAASTVAADCGARPQAAVLTSAFSETLIIPSPSPSPSPTTPMKTVGPSPSPSATTPMQTVGPSPSPSATTPMKTVGPSPSKTPSTSPTTPMKTVSPSPSPSKSTTPPPPTPQLCVGLQAFSGSGDVKPGQTASYAIWVWAVGASAAGVDVRIQASKATDVAAPAFNVCPDGRGATCSVGSLSTSRSDEVAASIGVGRQAPGGDHMVLTVTATARGARTGSASAGLEVVTPSAADRSGTMSSVALELGSVGGDYPPLVNYPGVTPVNPTTLFPTVSPGRLHHGRLARHIDAVTTAAVTPLGSLMLSGQVLGLAVLAGAVALAFVRFSLRTPQAGGPRKPESTPD
jgi:hypothetical protein